MGKQEEPEFQPTDETEEKLEKLAVEGAERGKAPGDKDKIESKKGLSGKSCVMM